MNFFEQQQQLVCYGLCCVWKISSICVWVSPLIRLLTAVSHFCPEAKVIGWKRGGLSGEIERDTDKKTRRRRRPGQARLWRKGVENWRIFSFLLGSTKEMVKGLSHHRMIITGVLFYIFMFLRSSSSSSWLSLPVSSLSAPAEVDRFAPWQKKNKKKRPPPTLIGPQDP